MSESKVYPCNTRLVHFKKHQKIWQGHFLGAAPIYFEACSPEDAKKKCGKLLVALGFDVSDETKWEYRMLPIATLRGELPITIRSVPDATKDHC